MSIGLVFLMSLACVAAFLITLIRVIGLRYVLKYATHIDVIFTICLALIMAGTLTGILIAIVAGLIMAGVLSIAKACQRGIHAARSRTAKVVNPVVAEDWCPGGSAGRL